MNDVRVATGSSRDVTQHHPSITEEVRAIARLSAPISLAQIGLVAMGLVDTAILGRESVDDLAAAGLGRSVGFAALSFGLGIATALEPLASQAMGARDPKRAWQAHQSGLLAVLLAWPLIIAASIVATFYLPNFGISQEVAHRARLFLFGQAPGQLLFLGFLVSKAYLQAHGSTFPALFAAGSANVVNFLVCQLFVRGDEALRSVHLPPIGFPKLGAFGAGCSSSVASLVLFGIVWYSAHQVKPGAQGATAKGGASNVSGAPMERANTTEADPIGVPKIFKIGIPIGFQMLAEIAVFSVCALHAGQFGERSESAHQIALGLASFTFMGALGISAGTAVRVGIAVGEGRSPAKIGLAGIALGSVVQSFGALVFFLWPTQLAGLFSTDTEVIRIGVQLLYIAAVFQLFDGMQAVAGGALRGIGDVRAAFVLNLVSYWVIGYPISLALAFGTNQLSAWNPAKYLAMPFKAVEGQGVRGLWLGLTVALVAVSLSMTGRFIALARKPIARL